jgi:hypothetical protein
MPQKTQRRSTDALNSAAGGPLKPAFGLSGDPIRLNAGDGSRPLCGICITTAGPESRPGSLADDRRLKADDRQLKAAD